MKYFIIDLPIDDSECNWNYIAFVTRLVCRQQQYTGYKELEKAGVDVDYFVNHTGAKILATGAIKVTKKYLEDHYKKMSFGEGETTRYFMDREIFDYEENLPRAFEYKDYAWFTSESEFNEYDEDMYEQLPDQLKKWFLRKIKTGGDCPAQTILDNTYNKYVIGGAELIQWTPSK